MCPLPPRVTPCPKNGHSGGGREDQQWPHCCLPLAQAPEGPGCAGGAGKGLNASAVPGSALHTLRRRRGREPALLPSCLGTLIAHVPWSWEDAWRRGCLGCRIPGDGCSGASWGGRGPGTGWHGEDSKVWVGVVGSTGRGTGGCVGRGTRWQLDGLCYSAAPQVGGPGAAEPAVPEGDRAWLVWQGEPRDPQTPLPGGTRGPDCARGVWGVDGGMRLSLPPGVPGGGELRHQQHAGGGEGAEGQCQRAGPDAVPGRSAALQVPLGSLHTAGSGDPVPGGQIHSGPPSAAGQSRGCPLLWGSTVLSLRCSRTRAVQSHWPWHGAAVRSWAELGPGEGGTRGCSCPSTAEQTSLCDTSRALGRAGTRSQQPLCQPQCRQDDGSQGLVPSPWHRKGDDSQGAATNPPRPVLAQAGPWCTIPPLLCPTQSPPAHQPAAVPGPVRRGHPVPAGDGVLPAGESLCPAPRRAPWLLGTEGDRSTEGDSGTARRVT